MAPITNVVQMEDGREVTFVGANKKMLKESSISEAGVVSLRMDFINGSTRSFSIPAELLLQFAAHGVEQKLGDSIAGIVEVDDCVLSVEAAITRLEAGEWSKTRESNGMAGTSVLLRALVEHTGKAVDTIKDYLKDKTQAQKIALRNNEKVKVIVDRLEAEKNANKKGSQIDTDALLEELV